MVKVTFEPKFEQVFRKIKDNKLKEQIIKQVAKIKANPKVGKPMRNVRKGMRELYIRPFRLSYAYHIQQNIVFIFDLYHKEKQ